MGPEPYPLIYAVRLPIWYVATKVKGSHHHHGDNPLLEGSKSRQNHFQVQPPENTNPRQDDVFGCELQLVLSGVLPVCI